MQVTGVARTSGDTQTIYPFIRAGAATFLTGKEGRSTGCLTDKNGEHENQQDS